MIDPPHIIDGVGEPLPVNQQFATAIKLPPFWMSNPLIWFTQVEAQFNVSRITSDRSKYDQIVAQLPLEVINNIYDIIINPPERDLYNNLKNIVITRLSSSEEKRLEDLLTGSEIGARKPSDFYRFMLGIVGGSHMVSQNLLIKLWKRRLPKTVYIALTASGRSDLQELLDIADKVWESCQGPVLSPMQSNFSTLPVSIPDTVPSTTLSDILTTFNNFSANFQMTLNQVLQRQQTLESQLSSLQSTNNTNSSPSSLPSAHCTNYHNRRRSSSRFSNNRNNFDPTCNTICYYHQVYKDRAYQCGGTWCAFYKVSLPNNNSNNSKN